MNISPRRLRKTSTDAERKLWGALRDRRMQGAKFRRQQQIGRYIVDFVCFETRLIIEVDGAHHANDPPDRTGWLENDGFRVIRFWNNDVLNNIEAVLSAILLSFEGTPHPAPAAPPSPTRGEG